MPIKSTAIPHCHWRSVILIIVIVYFFASLKYRYCDYLLFFDVPAEPFDRTKQTVIAYVNFQKKREE